MMSYSFSIKMLGCTFGIGMTIGIPLFIVKNANDKKEEASKVEERKKKEIITSKAAERQNEIDNPENLQKFFSISGLVKISEGEMFSDKAIKAWNPNNDENHVISKNWSEKIVNMPNSFFQKYTRKWSSNEGVCYIESYNISIKGVGKIKLYIPFIRSQLKTWTTKNRNLTFREKIESMETNFGTFLWSSVESVDKRKSELQKIIDANQGQETAKTASDLLFLHTRYKNTISRLETLGNIDSSVKKPTDLLWDCDCK